MLYSLDIETACNVNGCEEVECGHALDPHRNKITVLAIYKEDDQTIFRNLKLFRKWLENNPDAKFVGHNLKFDLKVLNAHGVPIMEDRWEHDTSLMATVFTTKIPKYWLEEYENRRRELNKSLPKGKGHRKASFHSLKTLAPFFLGVEPFWEATLDHDNDEYVLKDAKYTYHLYEFLHQKLEEEGSYSFYKEKLLPWTKLLLEMEMTGIEIDLDQIKQMQERSLERAAEIKKKLDEEWAEAYKAYRQIKIDELSKEYEEKFLTAKYKLTAPSEERLKSLENKYAGMLDRAVSKLPLEMNLDSPVQLKWLLQDYLKLDITDFHDNESTGKPVLKKLADGRESISLFLEYRAERKLATAFFPSYLDMQHNGKIHCNFNPFVARTGRLSSSSPNLQQVPGSLHKIFKARDGFKLITKDESAIEPRLIAYASECPVLYKILSQGLDFHGYNAKIFFDLKCDVNDVKKLFPKEREVGKEVGLAILYGAGKYRLQESAQKRGFIWEINECEKKVQAFKKAYMRVYQYKYELDEALKAGICAYNMFGRPFTIPDPQDVHMQGLNTLIQGSASDLVLNSAYRMQKAFKERGIKAHVLLLVHDEIVVEAEESRAEEVAELMNECMTDYKLNTKLGFIKLATEGKISDRWEK